MGGIGREQEGSGYGSEEESMNREGNWGEHLWSNVEILCSGIFMEPMRVSLVVEDKEPVKAVFFNYVRLPGVELGYQLSHKSFKE